MHSQHTAALNGLDPVSYFKNCPTQGDITLKSEHNGTAYYFSNDENKAAFDGAPDHYAPQYGGWCATAMSEGKLFGADPTNYKITSNRLFVFYRGLEGDTLPQWNENPEERLAAADTIWQEESYATNA